MFRNYLTIATRHLTRHKLFTVINILCLSMGITFSMVIGVYVLKQESVNSELKNVNSQYIIKSNWKVKGMGLEITTVAPLAKAVKEEYPGLVKNYYRYNPVSTVISVGDNHFKENIAIGDTTLVSMYGFPVLYGNKEQAFLNVNSAVITESAALKLFGRKDVISRSFSMQTTLNGESQEYMVSAVLKDIPPNSVTGLVGTDYNVFVPTVGNRFYSGGDPASFWTGAFEIAMIELHPGILPKDLEQPFKNLLAKYTADNIKNNLKVELAPVKDYHIKDNNSAVQKMITTLSLVALFILLMAVINFININIGTSSYRLKEIGLRKVFGGARMQLIIQFITEAWVLTFIATIISLVLYTLLRPVFNQVLNTDLEPLWQFNIFRIISLVFLVVFIGFIAGVYPAFILSSSNLIHSVKGKIDNAKGGLLLRKSLLIIQFTLAIVVFISALNVSRQVSYFFNKDLGYDKEQLLVLGAFPKRWDSIGVVNMQNIKKGLMQLPDVKSASLAFEIPERKPPNTADLLPIQKGSSQPLVISNILADEDYAATFGLTLTEGAFFTHSGGFIPNQIVLNESAVKALGLAPGAAVGNKIKWSSANISLVVAGVVKDFNYSSLQQQIEPVVFMHVNDTWNYRFLTLKLNTPGIAKTIDNIKMKWKSLSPNAPFEYFFMDEKFQSLYQSELQLKKAANIATMLNLIIVFMGIFGVVAFTLTKRTKEIAVRKVLGADVRNIIFLFIKDYALLILFANIIAWPLAYFISSKWLQQYAYRIQQNAVPYITVSVLVFIIAFALIIVQCFKAANMNPVKSLRAE